MFIHSYSILAYAQTFSMNFPPNGVSGIEQQPITHPDGTVTRMFSFFNLLFNPDAGGSLAEPFDALLTITHFPIPMTLPGDMQQCEEAYGKININTIDFTIQDATCVFFDQPKITKYLLPDPPYNNMMITYEAEDQFSLNGHSQDFINSLRTLHLEN